MENNKDGLEKSKSILRLLSLNFYKAIDEITREYESLKEENYRLSDQLKEWNKDEEIQKLKDELRGGYRIPAEVMKKIHEAEDDHYEKTKDPEYDKAKQKKDLSGGHRNTYIVIGETHLDDIVRLYCNDCKKVLYEEWI